MSVSKVLPNEVLINVISNLDSLSIRQNIAKIPELKALITIRIDVQSIQQIMGNIKEVPIASYFNNYEFVEIVLDRFEILNNDALSFKLFMILRILLNNNKKNFNIRIDYLLDEIDLNFLKMFKSFFHMKHSIDRSRYVLNFPSLFKIKINSNHLLTNSLSNYQNLESLNLYYCSSTFFFQIFEYLNIKKHPNTFPKLKHLKIQDYMNESEDVYLHTSDNYISQDFNGRSYDDDASYSDPDEFDHNSDFDENEFYFDGLEILKSTCTFNLESLTIKNCNLSILNNMEFPNLKNLKIVAVNDKHIDAYDLINSDNFAFTSNNSDDADADGIKSKEANSFKSDLNLSIMYNHLPQLKNFILIGNLNLKRFQGNILEQVLDNVYLRCVDLEIDSFDRFKEAFAENNELAAH